MAFSRAGKNGFPENGFNLYCGDIIQPSSNLFRPTSQLLTFSRLADSALTARSQTRGPAAPARGPAPPPPPARPGGRAGGGGAPAPSPLFSPPGGGLPSGGLGGGG